MAKGTELLLAKQSVIETLLSEAYARKSPSAIDSRVEQQAGGVWERFMQQFEALTQMRVENGAAIINIRGMITPDDPTAVFYGETNLAMLNADLNAALADSKVKKIILNAYTPGGYVYGVEAAANRIYEARKQKPVYGFTDSLAASAGYWLLSACDKVFLGSETAEVGSIGVYLAHFDYSEMLDKMGIKVTEITSGEFKGIGSPYSAMTAEEKKELQKDSHYIYTRFVNTVARNRGMAVADVLKSANGLTFYGDDAIKAGLADSITTLQEVIEMTTAANNTPTPEGANAAAAIAAAQQASTEAATANARADKAEAELKAYREASQKAANDAAAVECKAAVMAAFGREATAEEITFFTACDENGRKVYKANLAESKANRDVIIKKAGLTEEQVTGGKEVDQDAKSNLLLNAASRLGFIVPNKAA